MEKFLCAREIQFYVDDKKLEYISYKINVIYSISC